MTVGFSGLVMIVVMDRRYNPASRAALVEWCQKAGEENELGLVTGVSGATLARVTRGLKCRIYNAGGRECIPAPELAGWLTWRSIRLLEGGRWLSLSLADLKQTLACEAIG